MQRNAFTYLELGILPIDCEIHIRQLSYLHRILNLEAGDPVREMLTNMKIFSECGEVNWWTGVSKLLEIYNLNLDLEVIRGMSKDSFKDLVKKHVKQHAFEQLKLECQSKKKTTNVIYSQLKPESYLSTMFPNDCKLLFQCRSGTLDIKDHRAYKYGDRLCRGCSKADETLDHVLNCDGENGEYEEKLQLDFGDSSKWDVVLVGRCVQRIRKFLTEVDS